MDSSSANKKISVVIPSFDGSRGGNVERLVFGIKKQTVTPDEIIIVQGASPCSRAHNLGVESAGGDIIVFFDDDVTLGHQRVIESLVSTLERDRTVGMVGASQIIPESSNSFQRLCAKQLPRVESNIVVEDTESDMVTHAGVAIRKNLYRGIGGEDEDLTRNDDLLLRYKVKSKGYKLILAKNTWVYHPQPQNLKDLIEKSFNHGRHISYDYKKRPDLILDSPLGKGSPRKSGLFNQVKRNIKLLLSLKSLLLFSRLAIGLGFLWGRISNFKPKYNRKNESIKKVIPKSKE